MCTISSPFLSLYLFLSQVWFKSLLTVQTVLGYWCWYRVLIIKTYEIQVSFKPRWDILLLLKLPTCIIFRSLRKDWWPLRKLSLNLSDHSSDVGLHSKAYLQNSKVSTTSQFTSHQMIIYFLQSSFSEI